MRLARPSSSALSSLSTTGRSSLASMSGMRPETTTASCSAEMKRRVRCSGRTSTYSFERRDVGAAGLFGEPAPQRLERPDVADAGLLLDDRMHVGDDLRASRAHRAMRPWGTRSARRSDWRRSAWRRAVRSPPPPAACRAPGRRAGSAARDWRRSRRDRRRRAGDQAVEAGPADHAHRDPAAEAAQRVDAGIGALDFGGEDLARCGSAARRAAAPASAPRAAR